MIDAPCLDCGEPIRIQLKDGVIESAEPEGIHSYVDIPIRSWRPNLAYS